MSRLLFVGFTPEIEKEAPRARVKVGPLAAVGTVLLLILGVAVVLYAMKQPEPGRLVLDLAVAFFTWCTGRTVGEKAGIERSQSRKSKKS